MIKSLDTYIFIIDLGMSKQFSSELLLHTCTVTNLRAINLRVVRQQIGDGIGHASLGLRAMNGCDSVSGFYVKGKVETTKLLFKEKTFQLALGELGMQAAPSEGYLEHRRSISVICTVT